ncbi:MAG: 1-deoxy-D-xylulose-5-phosphate synthase [Lachnospiraceae bacterium]|nr:1-deoxy-D-xylulose-5-phosphate synthase [Lachnospiraceae bacterium]
MDKLLDLVQCPDDIKKLSEEECGLLCAQIREFLVCSVAGTGGHLSSNLGVVELTLALHRVFDLPRDKVVWDVGHQSYVHKILSGRGDRFDSLRKEGGLSGFPKVRESDYDVFDTGHASNSVSIAYGLARARDMQHQDHRVLCVIGDGSLTGGMAFEALNNAGQDKTGLIVILNDNKMSINRSVGAISGYLSRIRTGDTYIKGKRKVKQEVTEHPGLKPVYEASRNLKNRIKYMISDGVLFEEMGFTYLGPVNGHDLTALEEVMTRAKSLSEPVLIHVITKKGKGYVPAELEPDRFHGTGPFDVKTGKPLKAPAGNTYADVFGAKLSSIGEMDPSVVLVTAAMSDGTGLSSCDSSMKDRIFDVGIAEEHAVTFAGGLARGGMKPYVAIYSTFIQRAYDQIMQDICLQDLPVVLALDHGGIAGEDGETHQGLYDLAFLSSIPNMTIMAPSCAGELERMLEFSHAYPHPCAIRYPKGTAPVRETYPEETITLGKGVYLIKPEKRGEKTVTLVSLGACLEMAESAALTLREEGYGVGLVDARFMKPLDETLLEEVFRTSGLVITLEEASCRGGFGESILALAKGKEWKAACLPLALPDIFLPQCSRDAALDTYGLSEKNILKQVHEYFSNDTN